MKEISAYHSLMTTEKTIRRRVELVISRAPLDGYAKKVADLFTYAGKIFIRHQTVVTICVEQLARLEQLTPTCDVSLWH